jgi:hypothetical protein
MFEFESDNITSKICVNCICLPVCISKTHVDAAADCTHVRSLFLDVAKSIRFNEEITISFLGINKTYFINCDSCNFSIAAFLHDPDRKWHIFTYPTDDLADVDFNVEGKDLKP